MCRYKKGSQGRLRVDQLQVAGDEEGLLVLARVVGLGLEQDVANELLWR